MPWDIQEVWCWSHTHSHNYPNRQEDTSEIWNPWGHRKHFWPTWPGGGNLQIELLERKENMVTQNRPHPLKLSSYCLYQRHPIKPKMWLYENTFGDSQRQQHRVYLLRYNRGWEYEKLVKTIKKLANISPALCEWQATRRSGLDQRVSSQRIIQ